MNKEHETPLESPLEVMNSMTHGTECTEEQILFRTKPKETKTERIRVIKRTGRRIKTRNKK